jgi:hypothetical protein
MVANKVVSMTRAPERPESLIACPQCKLEMRLLGIERESGERDLYTFECERCERFEVRGVRVP